jgi:hypothetical protein
VTEVIQAAADLQAFCEKQEWQFCFIGGLALQRWGEPRETVDVDLTLLTGFGREEQFVKILLQHYEARIEDAADFALLRRVLLLRAPSGVGLDIALGGLPFEEGAIARSTLYFYPGNIPIRTCSAEDLLVMKAFASRPKDWIDAEGIVIRQKGNLDWKYVIRQLKPLAELKGTPEILDQLEKLRTSVA